MTNAFDTIENISSKIEHKEISPVELVDEMVDRIEKYDDVLKTYISKDFSKAKEQALKAEQEIQQGKYVGKLHGIPLALKDIFTIKDEVVTFGSEIFKSHKPNYDATVIQNLKSEQAIFLGKLNLHEFAAGGTNDNKYFGACKNPWDIKRIPGGSSGGSAAALSAGLTFGSLGTDTAGSIRIPSALCGTVGLKPTYGLVDKKGSYPLSWSLDHVGPMARSVRDVAILLDAITKSDSYYLETNKGIDFKNLTIGLEEDYYFGKTDSRINETIYQLLKDLERLGATIKVIKLPTLENALYAEYVTFMSEAATIHEGHLKENPHQIGDNVKPIFQAGHLITSSEYIEAQQIRTQLNNEFKNALKEVDVIIGPTLASVAPKKGEEFVQINGQERFIEDLLIGLTCPTNLIGYPTISLPCGLIDELPCGLQIVGKPFDEVKILQLAKRLEEIISFDRSLLEQLYNNYINK